MTEHMCSIVGCERPTKAHGWCNAHYLRWRTYGDPTGHAARPTSEDRFWNKVNKTDTCWLWTASTNQQGYGQLTVNYQRWLAHRFAYQLVHGEVPDVLDHTCHRPLCVRPEHLRPVTKKQNSENRSGPTANNTSGALGVFWSKVRNRWTAQVGHRGKAYHVGYFDTIEEAEAAVIAKRNELFTHNDLDRMA